MSDFQVRVVEIKDVRRHEGADSLSIALIGGEGGFPVVFRTGDYKDGDKAVYVPVSAAVPADDPRWAFLVKPGFAKPYVEVEAKRLRGVFSMGLLTPADPAWEVGRDVAEELRITRAEAVDASSASSADNIADPGLMPVYTDIDNLRQHPRLLVDGEEVQVTEKIHGECVFPGTLVTMADGSKRKIKDVDVGDAVLGMRDGVVVPSLVTHVFREGPPKRWMRVQGERRSAGRGNSFFRVICTPEHRFWNPERGLYVPASEMKQGDKVSVVRNDAGLTPVQEQVLMGKMLGDGSLMDSRWSAHVQWSHCADDAGYLEWTARALGDLATDARTPQTSGYGSAMIHANTRNSAWIKDMFSGWFSATGAKRVPVDIIGNLAPLALAFWYMDDGSLSHDDGQEDRASFATCAFDEVDHLHLVAALDQLCIAAKAVVYDHPRLTLNADNAERLFLMVAPYIPPCMQRKLPERYRGGPGWLPDPGKQRYKPMTNDQVVTIVADEDMPSSTPACDLETETNNYFASDVLVHNSARYCVADDGTLYCGSRTRWKHPEGGDDWTRTGVALKLAERLRGTGLGIYGELYGNVAGMRYDANATGRGLRLFDIMDLTTRRYLDVDDFLAAAAMLKLPTVPVLHRGPWSNDLRALVDGASTLAPSHTREGFVVRPVRERMATHGGTLAPRPSYMRVVLKYCGERYLTKQWDMAVPLGAAAPKGKRR